MQLYMQNIFKTSVSFPLTEIHNLGRVFIELLCIHTYPYISILDNEISYSEYLESWMFSTKSISALTKIILRK